MIFCVFSSAIIVLPVIVLALSFKIGFAVPELLEGLIIAAWTIYMSARLLKPLTRNVEPFSCNKRIIDN